jgi:hypothetical protein
MNTQTEQHERLIEHIKGIRRIVINDCYGGFGLSSTAVLRYLELLGKPVWGEIDEKCKSLEMWKYWLVSPDAERVDPSPTNWHDMTMAERIAHNQAHKQQVFDPMDIARDDPYLVQVIEELGNEANSKHAKLKIVEIPAHVKWQIEEYDGNEWVAEAHQTWR